MKYGQQLERESVPEWSLHNLDYNSLKHEIKVHTTRDQATAMTIPGQQDTGLKKFEDNLYHELCRQHHRVNLFVISKADEISRRLEHLATKIQRWAVRFSEQAEPNVPLKRQRRIARTERELLRCGEEILGLSRFANAQVVAFRKILKKYKKWTGSNTLTSRFSENVLSNPKSFTRRTFHGLQFRYDELLNRLQAATPPLSEPSSPETDQQAMPDLPTPHRPRQIGFKPLPPPHSSSKDSQVKYWNEYDDGSEGGEPDDDYAIYINPDDDGFFPGFAYVNTMLSFPYAKAKQWLKQRRPSGGGGGGGGECRPLLASEQGSSLGCASTVLDSDEEGYASSDRYPQLGYGTQRVGAPALPRSDFDEQKARRHQEKMLTLATASCFVVSFTLLGIAGLLMLTGRHRLRVQVDTGVTVGTVFSLFCAGSGLGTTWYHRKPLSWPYKMMVWSAFGASCILNGMLLIVVLGHAP